jgi:hypothetical protein
VALKIEAADFYCGIFTPCWLIFTDVSKELDVFIFRQHRCENLKSRLFQFRAGFISKAKSFYLGSGWEICAWLTLASITCGSLLSAGGVSERGTLKRNGHQILDSLGGDTSVWHACQMASRLVCQARFQQQTNPSRSSLWLTTPPPHYYILEVAYWQNLSNATCGTTLLAFAAVVINIIIIHRIFLRRVLRLSQRYGWGFRNIILRQWVNGSRSFDATSLDPEPMKKRTLRYVKTTRSEYQLTQHHIPEEWNN